MLNTQYLKGVDPTQDQWKQIAVMMKKHNHIPLFDAAYQGFASGSLDLDAFPIRHFLENGFQMFVAQSYSKNMGLYGERIGACHIVTKSKTTADNIMSQLKTLARINYLTPPMHGALIVHRILSNPSYFKRWESEFSAIAGRIIKMRNLLRSELERLKTPGNWEHITNQIGMFSFTGLTEPQCTILIDECHIYMLKDGRINMVRI